MVTTDNYNFFYLHSLEHWSEKWLLKFNREKCHKMSIGHNLPTAYYLTGVNGAKQVEQVPEERDLRILIIDDMNWSKQCNSAAAKAVCAWHDQNDFQ